MTFLVSGVLGTLYFCLDNDNLLFWSREKGGSSEPNELPLDPPLQKKVGHQVPSLENWGSGLKSLSWHANSPHTPSVQTLQQTTTKIYYTDSRKKKYIYIYIILYI